MRRLRALGIPLLLLVAACNANRRPIPLYYLAESALRRGQLDEAVHDYKLFLQDPGPDGRPYVPRSYYMLALAYYRKGQLEDALAQLDKLDKMDGEGDSVQVLALRGDIHDQLGDRVAAVRDWDRAWRIATAMDRQRLERRLTDTLQLMNADQVEQADASVNEPGVHAIVADRIKQLGGSLIPDKENYAAGTGTQHGREKGAAAKGRHKKGGGEEAAQGSKASPPEEAPAEAPIASPVELQHRKIACLVPLTGAHRSEGDHLLNAVRLAFGADAPRVLEFDADETADAARASWGAIASDPNILATIAWLPDAAAAREVAALAARTRVPLVSLSRAGAPQAAGARAGEIAALADYMTTAVRIQDFAILYPATPSGEEYRQLFRSAVEQHSGRIVGSQSYRPEPTSFGAQLDQIRKWRARDVNAGAVFIPDDGAAAVGLAAAINEHYPDMIVLGLSDWSNSANVRAFVAESIAGEAPSAAPADFAARYQEAAGAAPGPVELRAYSAAAMLHDAITQPSSETRAAVQLKMSRPEPGAGAQMKVRVLRLSGGKSEQVYPPAA